MSHGMCTWFELYCTKHLDNFFLKIETTKAAFRDVDDWWLAFFRLKYWKSATNKNKKIKQWSCIILKKETKVKDSKFTKKKPW